MNSGPNHEVENFCSTLFHNILNPLTVISLELDTDQKKIPILQGQVDTMIHHLTHLEYFVSLLCQNIKPNTFIKNFSLNEEIEQALQIVSYKAKRQNVQLVSLLLHEVNIFGDQLKFHEYLIEMLELFLEDSSKNSLLSESESKKIEITLEKKKTTISLVFQLFSIPFFSPLFSEIQKRFQQEFSMKILLSKEKNKQKIVCKFEAKS